MHTVDEAVLHAGLCRGLASTCLRELAEEPQAPPPPRMEPLQAARWRAARFGWENGYCTWARVARCPPPR